MVDTRRRFPELLSKHHNTIQKRRRWTRVSAIPATVFICILFRELLQYSNGK
jgi:hypothetical protein